MIIVKTKNGSRFINEAEVLQVNHVKDKEMVEVWPSRWGNQQQQPQFFIIEDVESVVYTSNAHDHSFEDEGLEVEVLKKNLEEINDQNYGLRIDLLKITLERDQLEDELNKLKKKNSV